LLTTDEFRVKVRLIGPIVDAVGLWRDGFVVDVQVDRERAEGGDGWSNYCEVKGGVEVQHPRIIVSCCNIECCCGCKIDVERAFAEAANRGARRFEDEKSLPESCLLPNSRIYH
jgi:hypothetical protein